MDSPIHRLHPVVKIYGIFCLGISALVYPSPILSYILVIFLFVVAALAKLLKGFSKFVIGFAIPITVMLLFIHGLYSSRNVTYIADLGFARLGLEGTMYAIKIVGGLLVFLGSFYITTTTTYPGKLVTALVDAGMNPKAGYLILASLNVVPQMQRRMTIIREAQMARGVEVDGNLFTRAIAFVPLIGPLVMSSLVDVQERSMTLETRGFGAKGVRPTSYVEAVQTPVDRLLQRLLVVFLAVTVITSIAVRYVKW